MDDADSPRCGDRDGRGDLSLKALIEFVTWFCQVALDQVAFMARLFDLDTLEERLRRYVEQTLGLDESPAVLAKEVLRRGELARGEAPSATGRPERTARAVLSKLVSAGLLVSDTPKGAVRLRFTSESADMLFPRLFGAQLSGG